MRTLSTLALVLCASFAAADDAEPLRVYGPGDPARAIFARWGWR